MKNKILPCVVGLGYVGLPVFLKLNKYFQTVGYDINQNRVTSLNKFIDTNKEFSKQQLKLKKGSKLTNNIKEIDKCNFFIISVPTPIKKNFEPDLDYLKKASVSIAKIIKKNDIVVFESTVYPGTTKKLIKEVFDKITTLKENKDYFICYSPERVNPGDKKHAVDKITKILAIKSNNSSIIKRTIAVYKKITKKLKLSKSIEDAETAKVIENVQRDLNIALMNDILMFTKKLKLNYTNILDLASTKWNFLKFNPGLVGGHCLPVDPYYLNYIAKKNKIKLKTILSGREVNNSMKYFILKEIKNKRKKLLKENINPKILICGITYKRNVSDTRNSISLEIYNVLKKKFNNIFAFDNVCNSSIKNKFKIFSDVKNVSKYNLIIFLVNHDKNKEIFKKAKKNIIETYDPFHFYS